MSLDPDTRQRALQTLAERLYRTVVWPEPGCRPEMLHERTVHEPDSFADEEIVALLMEFPDGPWLYEPITEYDVMTMQHKTRRCGI